MLAGRVFRFERAVRQIADHLVFVFDAAVVVV